MATFFSLFAGIPMWIYGLVNNILSLVRVWDLLWVELWNYFFFVYSENIFVQYQIQIQTIETKKKIDFILFNKVENGEENNP